VAEWLVSNVATWILICTYKFKTYSKTLLLLRILVYRKPWYPFAEPFLRNTGLECITRCNWSLTLSKWKGCNVKVKVCSLRAALFWDITQHTSLRDIPEQCKSHLRSGRSLNHACVHVVSKHACHHLHIISWRVNKILQRKMAINDRRMLLWPE
jgi:hypothetical protein